MAATKELTALKTTYLKFPGPILGENRDIPAAPTNITQDLSSSNTTVVINWTDSVSSGINHYNLLLDDVFSASVLPGVETYTYEGLVANSVHTASIEAVNDLGIRSDRWELDVQVPLNNIIFDVDLGVSTTPIIGSGSPSFDASGTTYYADSVTSLATKSANTPCLPAYVLGGSTTTKTGMYFGPYTTNLMLQSEAPGTTWVSVGSPTSINNNVGTFLGTLSYGTIVASASGDGISQASATAAASAQFVGSVYVSTGSGTLGGTLTIEGSSGGTPETATQSFTATTTPTRVYLYQSFTGSATGNAQLKITTTAAGTLRLSGMMLNLVGGTTDEPYLKVPVAYVKTTTGTASSGTARLSYQTANNISFLKGTATYWCNPFFANTDQLAGIGNVFLGAPGHNGEFLHTLQKDSVVNWYNGAVNFVADTTTKNQWVMYTFTWDQVAGTATINKNGVRIKTGTFSKSLYSFATMYLGIDSIPIGLGASDSLCGLLGRVRIWNGVNSDAADLALYNNEKANYGL